MARLPKKFIQAITIKQVGAKPIMTKRGTLFKLGGGVFTKRQILGGRRRWARISAPKSITKKLTAKDFGL